MRASVLGELVNGRSNDQSSSLGEMYMFSKGVEMIWWLYKSKIRNSDVDPKSETQNRLDEMYTYIYICSKGFISWWFNI